MTVFEKTPSPQIMQKICFYQSYFDHSFGTKFILKGMCMREENEAMRVRECASAPVSTLRGYAVTSRCFLGRKIEEKMGCG